MVFPTWLIWLVATLIAIMPMSILLIARSVDKVRPKRRRAKPVEYNPLVSGDGDLDYEELELLAIAHMVATVQMRQRWGKDISTIV